MPRIEMLPDGPVYKEDDHFRKDNNAEILPEDSAVSARISDDKKKNPNKIDEPEKHFYHFGKGDDELTLGVYSHTDFFLDNINEYWYKALRFNLTRADNTSFYEIGGSYKLSSNPLLEEQGRRNMLKDIAKRLYADESEGAVAVKKFLKQITGNPLVDAVNRQMNYIEEINSIDGKLSNKVDKLLDKTVTPGELWAAKESVRKAEIQELIDTFEKGNPQKNIAEEPCTRYNIVWHYDDKYGGGAYREYIYGLPVMEDNKLKGFNMMHFDKVYLKGIYGKHEQDEPYKDKNGKQIFMNVEEYYDFYMSLNPHAERLFEEKAKALALNQSKLAKLRKRAAKFADKGSEVLGLEKAVKKVTRGKKIANVKISPKIKAKEKKFSDLFFGRVKD